LFLPDIKLALECRHVGASLTGELNVVRDWMCAFDVLAVRFLVVWQLLLMLIHIYSPGFATFGNPSALSLTLFSLALLRSCSQAYRLVHCGRGACAQLHCRSRIVSDVSVAGAYKPPFPPNVAPSVFFCSALER
jgi:hypothetical protein